MKFLLPPEVTFRKEVGEGCTAYIFRHDTLGELGRVLLHNLPDGQCNVACEVSGDPADPMTETRLNILRPLSKQMIEALELAFGSGEQGYLTTPPFPKAPQEIVESKLMPCNQCGAYAAMLIFAYGAKERGDFEDYARKMYAQYQNMNVPTWIIGESIGIEGYETPSKMLKVWPNREPIQEITPNVLNAQLDVLMAEHCR